MLLTRPLQLLAVAAGTGSILLAVLSSAAVAQRPMYQSAQPVSHGCCVPCPEDSDAVPTPTQDGDLPEVADLGDGGYASAPQSAVPNAIGDSMGGCFTGYSSSDSLTGPVCVGGHRFKIGENNSALPQHRIYYNYHYFDNALRVTEGQNTRNIDVQRHTFGLEYPFWCDMASFGVEIPIANTVSSDLVPGNHIKDTEFGNISLYLKTVLYQDCCKTFSAGLGIALPTADDVTVVDSDTLTLDNDVVVLSPFVALLVADPCSNMFMHGSVQVDLPTDEYSVVAFGEPGAIRDHNLLHLDGSIGYWLSRDCCGNGVAAIAELHYTAALDGNATLANGGNSISRSDFDHLNATLGVNVARNCWDIRPAVVLPLLDRPDRAFDWEFALQVNRRF